MTEFRDREFRDTMGQFCTGVVIVAGLDEGEMTGFAAQSFVSLSLEPPLIAVCPAKSSTSWPRIRSAGHFCINVLADDQRGVSETFARSGEVADIGWRAGVSGAPILDGVLAYVDCALDAEHDAGDHTIAVGRVLDIDILDGSGDPLLFFRGAYGGFLDTPPR
ncbi:MAG: flavin reductase family protein [Gammaproteobacteria bacterium]|nr:flavin reductase family protein [Gammaproteobacteria bacterium]